jgi:uncharacterized delta-60 repeat protein
VTASPPDPFSASWLGDAGLALQRDGKPVAAGWAWGQRADPDFRLMRFDIDGRLDTAFDLDGEVTTGITSGETGRAEAIVIQPDGRIVAAGDSSPDFHEMFALARYHPKESLDAGVGEGGTATTRFNDEGRATALVLHPHGKLVASGYSLHVTTVCGPSADECDLQDGCSGRSESYPDAVLPAGSPCSDDGIACPDDVCSGAGNACAHSLKNDPECPCTTDGSRDRWVSLPFGCQRGAMLRRRIRAASRGRVPNAGAGAKSVRGLN